MTMRNLRLYGYHGLLAGAALFALGPAEIGAGQPSDNAGLSGTHASPLARHAPLKLRIGPDGLVVRGPRNIATSTNWSGYALSTGTYTSASFSWTVPTVSFVNYPSGPAFEDSSSWVGIGGFATGDLIQLGTEQYVDSSGNTIYQPWYEVLPASETVLPSQYTISPGDAMSASLACTANCTANNPNMTWHLSMTNATKSWTWTGNFTYASSLSSAEWIQEAPTFSSIVAIPNFGTVNFTNLLANGANPNLSLSADGIQLQDAAGGFSTPCGPIGGNRFVAAWGPVCATVTASHSFNDDGHSDIAWRNTNGDTSIWLMNGTKVLSATDLGVVPSSWTIAGQRDFNGDGKADLVWHNTNGDTSIWLMNGTQVLSATDLGVVPNSWSIVGTGDFNGDGMGDILWRNTNGDTSIWLMNGTQVLSAGDLGLVPTSWSVAQTGDFSGDGKSDILWHNSNGDTSIWLMNGTQVSSATDLGIVPNSWNIAGTGDFNGDGKSDIIWRNSNGDTSIWLMNGTQVSSAGDLGLVPTSWIIAVTGDFNGDGKSDILWSNTNGDTSIWFMNGTQVSSASDLGVVPNSWRIQGAGAD
jgi:hypothetical protein